MSVEDAKADFELARSRAIFARLLRLCEEGEAELKRNPKRYLDQAAQEIVRLRRAVEQAYMALNPSPIVQGTGTAPSFVSSAADAQQRMLLAVRASGILREAMFPTERSGDES